MGWLIPDMFAIYHRHWTQEVDGNINWNWTEQYHGLAENIEGQSVACAWCLDRCLPCFLSRRAQRLSSILSCTSKLQSSTFNLKGRSNRRVTSKYHLSSHVTTLSVHHRTFTKLFSERWPANLSKTRPNIKKMKSKTYVYTYMQGRAWPSVSFIILSTIKSLTSGPSQSTRGCYCLLCPDQSNSIKFTPSTNHSGT
jgi:hypothetical protein